jgi:Cu-processing system permease protein
MALTLFLLVILIEIRYEGLINFYYGGHFYAEFFNAAYFEYLEFLVVIGVALVFSSFTTPVMSALFTFFVIAIGRFSNDIRMFAEEVKNPLSAIFSEAVYRVIPNLEKFDVRSEAVYGGTLNTDLILYTTAYALIYTLALLILTIIIFERKKFE